MPDNTFIDRFIRDGQMTNKALNKLYDTILVTNRPPNNDNTIPEITDIFRIPLYDTFLKYKTQFDVSVQLYNMPKRMFYQPKAASLAIYGTADLWLALLRLNGMRSIIDFTKTPIKCYEPQQMQQFLDIFFKREGKI